MRKNDIQAAIIEAERFLASARELMRTPEHADWRGRHPHWCGRSSEDLETSAESRWTSREPSPTCAAQTHDEHRSHRSRGRSPISADRGHGDVRIGIRDQSREAAARVPVRSMGRI